MHRCYIPTADFSKSTIIVNDSNEVHHLITVMRLGKGSVFCIFNAAGQMADVTIDVIGEREIVGRIGAVKQMAANGAKIILACAIPKRVKFEEIIEKATELGVDEIIPLKTARSEVYIKTDKAAEKNARFNKVAIAAAKQCGRGQVPVITDVKSLEQALKDLPKDVIKVIPSLHGHAKHIREAFALVPRTGAVAIFIGPEGDFTPQEVDSSIKAGCVPVTLGQTVLRVDTAAITTVSLARFLLRD